MKKLLLGTAATSMFVAVAVTLMFWPAKESNAQTTSRPLPGEQCTHLNRVTICSYKFDDGVRCLYAGDGGQMNAGPSVSVSCTLSRESAGVPGTVPSKPSLSPVG